MKRIVDMVLSYPKAVLGLFILGTAVLGWQAQKFEIDASADTLLTQNNRHYIETRVMNERFSPEEFLLVAYKPDDGDLFGQESIADIRSLSEQLQQIERVRSVRSILNVPLLSLLDSGSLLAEPGTMTLEQQKFSAQELRQALTGNPIYENLLVNEDLTATALQLLFEPNEELNELQRQITRIQKHALERDLSDDEQEQIEALEQQAEPLERSLDNTRREEMKEIRQLITRYQDDATIYLGGAHVLGDQLIQIIQNDLLLFGAIIAGIICLILFIVFRKPRWVLLPVVCCAASVFLTVGVFGMLGLKATVISSNFIALQLILTLALVIHLIVQYREYSAAQPDWSQKALVRATLRRKAKPCFYAGLTTSIGFASLLVTGIQPVVTFGWMMIVAMAFSIFTSLLLFPAMMMLFGREEAKSKPRLSLLLLKGFDSVGHRRPGWVMGVAGVALLVSVGGLFLLDVENSFIDYFRESTDVHRELSFIDRELGGSTPLDLILEVPDARQEEGELVISADTVQTLQGIQHMLAQQKGMGKLLSPVNFTQLAKEINDGKPLTEYELTAIYRSMGKDLREDLVGSFFAPEHSQLRISARIQDATEGLDRAKLIDDIHAGMQELGIGRDRYSLTNLFVLYQDILQSLFRSQIMALGLVYLALTLTFFAIFWSVRIALIGIAPNILSTLAVLGAMGWLSIPLDLMTITIASIAMGIAVDDTIHYIHRYQEETREGASARAIKNTNLSVGHAILYTSVIIMLGFSLLVFSDFMPSVQFGLLTSLAMVMALVWNLSLLPVLLHKFAGAGDTPG